MIIGLLKELHLESRVALMPENVASIKSPGIEILVEKDAGAKAFQPDALYAAAGAEVCERKKILDSAQLIVSVNAPAMDELGSLREGMVLLCAFNPLFDHTLVNQLAEKKISSFSLDVIPRTTRAQAMDVLSSMATVAGYKAVLTAALNLPRFFPMFMTAAGTIKPARLLVLGAGVAGLQSIATARKLGAVVEVFDVRAAVKEEVKGLGAKFIEVEGATDDKSAGGYAVEQTDDFKKLQAQMIHDHAVKSDVIICTAQIPGRKAPLLIRKDTVEAMKHGSVIIDLAASSGGNCELSENAQTVIHHGVKIIGNSDFASEMPTDASQMFGKNLLNFLKLLLDKEGNLHLNWDDDLVKGTCVTHEGKIVHERVLSFMNQQ